MVSPVGELTLVSDENNLVGIWFKGQKYYKATLVAHEVQLQWTPVLKKTKCWLNDYFSFKKPNVKDIPIKPQVSEFRQFVLEALLTIPYGHYCTYGQIAQRVAARMHKSSVYAQAVGGAIGHNPIAILIPCHRVIGSTGSLTGYAGGIDKKVQLLQHEGIDVNNFHFPS
ncbi:6-O-methylguanine-DNA methyltransferase [Liquorilactobacillus oeni DSM 19972]|uniref:methylated-DNA--[protein]-cysteine S-methyltransferase n=2 Tax=Liquorilactobacillus oeni TaxID=303241 RepID=A0A0R1M9N9_9LACO|nr:6-O-methylguanine-DNA methyltransferase [Liquorilactobacillus oeni DSM 19972]